MKREIRRWTLGIGAFLTLVVATAVITFNRSQPSETEVTVANSLVRSAHRAISNGQQTILYEASRNLVVVNAYGFLDSRSQGMVLDELRKGLNVAKHDTRVHVVFFPSRAYVVEERSDGRTISHLKNVEPIRRVELR